MIFERAPPAVTGRPAGERVETDEFGVRCRRCRQPLPCGVERAGELVECPACGATAAAETYLIAREIIEVREDGPGSRRR